ncbi:hypothetical protein Plhal710r2_c008g0035351 [Plasmopara halstedii]
MNGEHTTLLGIAVGPSISPHFQLNQVLIRFHKLCVTRRWRARPFLGGVLISIFDFLSTLWHFLGTVFVSNKSSSSSTRLCGTSSTAHPQILCQTCMHSHLSSAWHPVGVLAGGPVLPSDATSANRNLVRLRHKSCNYLSHQGLLRNITIRSVFGWKTDGSTLGESLACSSIKSERTITLAIQNLAPTLEVPLHYPKFSIFPLPPKALVCALHVWTLDGHDVVYASNTVIEHLLLDHDPPPLPLL